MSTVRHANGKVQLPLRPDWMANVTASQAHVRLMTVDKKSSYRDVRAVRRTREETKGS
jgi:hypothetical protein